MNTRWSICALGVLGMAAYVAAQVDCNAPRNEGDGDLMSLTTRYYWTGTRCATFLYTGSGGNTNRFNTENQCLCACDPDNCDTGSGSNPADCFVRFDIGDCADGDKVERYVYGQNIQRCRRKRDMCRYSDNGNNFNTLAECQDACEDPCAVCPACPTGQRNNGATLDNCNRCECVECDNCRDTTCNAGEIAYRTGTDADGCWHCSCKDCPTNCDATRCNAGEIAYQTGTDSDGCWQCGCRVCPTNCDATRCNAGEIAYQTGTDSDGCWQCGCRVCPTNCDATRCNAGEIAYQTGTDSDGCWQCGCRVCPTNCDATRCNAGGIAYQTGTDSDGCWQCACKVCPTNCNHLTCQAGEVAVHTGTEAGTGCWTCQCRQQTQQCPPLCNCRFGEVPVYYNAGGCRRCWCRRIYGCPIRRCPRYCPYGVNITQDSEGCEACAAADDPCETETCPGSKICMARTEKNCYRSDECTTKPVCVNAAGVCKQPLAQGGPCPKSGSLTRWYYNKVAKECRSFTYKGCLGTKNNFMTKRDCKRVCIDGN